MYRILLYFENKNIIYVSNFKNKNFINFYIPTNEYKLFLKIIGSKTIIYHFDTTIIHLYIKNKNKLLINIFNDYFKKYNYIILTESLYESIIYNSSIWINRELFDMFGLYTSKNLDNRKLLLDYNYERGVLIYC